MSVEDCLRDPNRIVIDVRSPSEFAQGHIPGAINVPLFTDHERALVGTTYKQCGQEQAISLGLEIAKAKLETLAGDLERAVGQVRKKGGSPSGACVHCWRGGMRSRAMKWLGGQLGVDLDLLEGGYKAFRRVGLNYLSCPARLVVLAGPTGAGKTRILSDLARAGQQVIDLEGLAHHRGSVFGGYADRTQPTTEQFQNELILKWRGMNRDQVIWFEGESQVIGRVVIPEELWQQLTLAPMIFIDVEVQRRIEFLLQDYGSRDVGAMIDAASRIKKRLGGLRYREAIDSAEKGDWTNFCRVMLGYYDKYYFRALEKRGPTHLHRMEIRNPGVLDNESDIIALADRITSS